MSGMGRREFVALVGGAAAWPLSASAQQPPERMRRIGIIDDAPMWNAFRQGLREHGYLEGQNIAFDYKYADGVPERLAKAAAELVRRPVDVIATYGTPPSRAAKEATATIPIVMTRPLSIGSGLERELRNIWLEAGFGERHRRLHRNNFDYRPVCAAPRIVWAVLRLLRHSLLRQSPPCCNPSRGPGSQCGGPIGFGRRCRRRHRLPSHRWSDSCLPKPKNGGAVSRTPAVPSLLVRLEVPMRRPSRQEGVLQGGDEHHRHLPEPRHGTCLLQPAVLFFIQGALDQAHRVQRHQRATGHGVVRVR